MTIERANLVGRWNVIEWVQNYDDGRVVYPLGQKLYGFVQYLENGDMFLAIAAGDRPNFSTGGQWNASDAEKAGAYNSYLTYAGKFEVHGDFIHHIVDIALCPNWVGGVQKRKATLMGDDLTLIARLEDGTPEARTAPLRWRRAGQ